MLKPTAWLGGVLLVSAMSILMASIAVAHEVKTEALRVAHPFATPTPPGAANGAAYVDITALSESVTLIGASSPASSRFPPGAMAAAKAAKGG